MIRVAWTVLAAFTGVAILTGVLVSRGERRWRRKTREALRLLPGVGDRLAVEALAWLAQREEQDA